VTPTGMGDISCSLAERANWVWGLLAQTHPEFKRENFVHDDNPFALHEIVVNNCCRFVANPGNLVMDVGANIGIFTALCALNGASVVAYEPNAGAFRQLLKTISLNGIEKFVNPQRIALASVAGLLPYWGMADETDRNETRTWSTCTGTMVKVVAATTTEAEVMRKAEYIDAISFADAVGVQEWDCVKIDIEGAEFELLLSASDDTLQRIKFLTVELHNGYVDKILYDRFIAYLARLFALDGIPDGDARFAGEGRYISLYATRKP